MTDQLQLAIREKVSYSAANFIEHGGVEKVCSVFRDSVSGTSFRLLFVEGARRAGKTHAAISFSEYAVRQGLFPHLLDGSNLSSLLQGDIAEERSVILVDDADQYLSSVQPGESGNFVRFIEHHRVLGSTIVLFSSKPAGDLPCDEHVMSRLIPGIGFLLEAPPEEAVAEVLFALAKQRGMKLTHKKLGYVSKRISRDIRSLEDYLDRVYRLARARGDTARFTLLADAL